MKLTGHVFPCLLAIACAHGPTGPTPDPTGIAAFSNHSRFVAAKISPNGTWLAAISTEGKRRALKIVNLKEHKLAAMYAPDPDSVGEFYWANDSRILVELWDESDGSLASPVNYGELYAIDAANGKGDMVFGYRATAHIAGPVGNTPARQYAGGSVLSRVRGDDRHVLIEVRDFHDWDDPNLLVSKLDVYTGRKIDIIGSPMPGAHYYADENGEPRIAAGSGPDLKPRYFLRETAGSWQPLALKGFGPNAAPLQFESQTRTLEVIDGLEKGFGVYAVNIDSGERKLISQNDWTPPSGLLVDRQHHLLAVEYEPDVPVWDFIVPDHPLSRALKGLLAAWPDDDVRFVSMTDDEKKAIAYVYSDRDPGRFFLVDTAKLTAEELVGERPWVKPEDSAETLAFHIHASDGMWIHGYVTPPKIVPPGVHPPMVVLPHGGPHGIRDGWAYDTEAQLLASQGFAVLEVNYRGSGGYGSTFQEAGYTHWGDRIIEDIIDATRYAIQKGYADGNRVCIYGGSFGAFAALQATVLAPDLYRCAAGYSGIYDLTLMASAGDIPETHLGRSYVKQAIGTGEAQLRAQSPVFNADKIKAKVLLIHGKKDRRAPIEHAEKMRKALVDAGAPEPGWLVEPHEGHGFFDEGARERMYAALLAFLRENTQ